MTKFAFFVVHLGTVYPKPTDPTQTQWGKRREAQKPVWTRISTHRMACILFRSLISYFCAFSLVENLNSHYEHISFWCDRARARAYSYLFHTLKQTDNNLGSYETQTEIQNKQI